MSAIDELIKLVQQATDAGKQQRMDGSGINQALDILHTIERKKLCVKAHEENKRLYALVAMHTGYSNDEIDMILEN